MTDSVSLIKPRVFAKGGVAFADSRDVAVHFGKRHTDVLRAIRNLMQDLPQDERRNFALCEQNQPHSSGASRIEFYEMTRTGLTLLVMGFTGAKALQWKLAYIAAFDEMERHIALRQPDGSLLPYHLRRICANRHHIPIGHFTVLSEMASRLIGPLEYAGYHLPERCWPDISEGKLFINWLKKQDFYDPSLVRKCKYEFEDRDFTVDINCYHNDLQGKFTTHLELTWIPQHSPKYFQQKAPEALAYMAKAFPQLTFQPQLLLPI